MVLYLAETMIQPRWRIWGCLGSFFMLKEAVASKAAKLLMTCVCPVAGTTALSLGVPQVRDAVYKATQPREYAKPKIRTRAPAEEPVEVAQNEACPPSSPFQLKDLPKKDKPVPPKPPEPTPPSPPEPSPPPMPPFPPVPPSPPSPDPGVPEPSTWLQLIVGFALVGGAARLNFRRKHGKVGAQAA